MPPPTHHQIFTDSNRCKMQKICHPERRATPGVEGSTHEFDCTKTIGAKILRLALLAQDDKRFRYFPNEARQLSNLVGGSSAARPTGACLVCVQNRLHIVHALALTGHELGGGHRAVGQHGPGAAFVLQDQGLGTGVDMDLVDADHIAHA